MVAQKGRQGQFPQLRLLTSRPSTAIPPSGCYTGTRAPFKASFVDPYPLRNRLQPEGTSMSEMLSARQMRYKGLVTASRLIAPELLAMERELTTTKWFGYRFMSPLEATDLFRVRYQAACQAYVRRNLDIEVAKRYKGVASVRPAASSGEFTQLWIARQRADAFCMPYESYLAFCFHFAGRRMRGLPPRPGQLHATDKTAVAWNAEFNKWRTTNDKPELDQFLPPFQYRVEAFSGLPAQVAFREYIFRHAKAGIEPWERVMGRWCLAKRVIPIWRFRPVLDRRLFASAVEWLTAHRSLLPSEFDPFVAPSPEAFWPTCFGVPGARDSNAAACVACPISPGCGKLAKLVSEGVRVQTGSCDPVGDRKRAINAARVAKFRAGQKAAATPAVLS